MKECLNVLNNTKIILYENKREFNELYSDILQPIIIRNKSNSNSKLLIYPLMICKYLVLIINDFSMMIFGKDLLNGRDKLILKTQPDNIYFFFWNYIEKSL